MQRERAAIYTPFRADLCVCVCVTQARLHKAWGVVPHHKGHWKKKESTWKAPFISFVFSPIPAGFSPTYFVNFISAIRFRYSMLIFLLAFPLFVFLSRLKEREICPGWMKQETMSQRFSSGKFAKRIKRQKGWSWLFLFETLSRIVCCFRFFLKLAFALRRISQHLIAVWMHFAYCDC